MKIIIKKKITKLDIINASKIFNENKLEIKQKKNLWNYPKNKQFLIYIKNKNNFFGMLRIIKRKIFLSGKFYNAACISTVGIFPNFRQRGYSKILINKSISIIKKKFDLAILIARKKTDFFYSKFKFVGNSEFFSITIKKKIQKNLNKKYIRTIKIKALNDHLKKLYIISNNKKNGFFKREKNDWSLINKKIKKEKNDIYKVKFKNLYIGYFISKKNQVIEYGYNPKFLDYFIFSLSLKFNKELKIENPDINFLNELKKNNEILINKRFCTYGGHMINFFQNKKLKNINYNINYFDEF